MYVKEIGCCSVLEVSVGTTGYCGGDSGHGGRTYIEITEICNTDIECYWNNTHKKLTINLGGDSELDTIIEVLDFILRKLKEAVSSDKHDRLV
jgi:hypothetical protein|tara:strand:+ start:652 stop:930 length:279 start_codon:yes stop_codon:yes gene_type:complete